MSVAGTKVAIVEMLESTLEHEILHAAKYNYHLCDFGKFETAMLAQNWQKGFLGGTYMVKVLLACLHTVTFLQKTQMGSSNS